MNLLNQLQVCNRLLLVDSHHLANSIQKCGMKNLKLPPNFDNVEFPENKKLRVMDKAPVYPKNLTPPKMKRMVNWMRGPEKIHNELLYEQYGIVADMGGRLKHVHFENIRNTINKNLDFTRMFAVWRVDAPYQACTKRPIGMTLGGGKGNIHHYVTPVKPHRIIIEVGGHCEYYEVKKLLKNLADSLPFKAHAVSQQILQREKYKERKFKMIDKNRFSMEYIIKNNMLGCRKWVKAIDYDYFGKYT